MRIALFTDTFLPEINGVANSVAHIAAALSKRGHEVCVCTVSSKSAEELRADIEDEYDVMTIPSIGLPIYLGVRITLPVGLALYRMRAFKPDIVHSHTPFSAGHEAVRVARRLRVPLVGTHHTFFDHYLKHVRLDYAWAQRLSWRLTVGYYNKCDLVISPTRSLAQGLREHGLTKPCEVVPNTIDTAMFSPPEQERKSSLKAELGITGKALVYMGRVSYEKSIDQLLRAFALIASADRKVKLFIVGDGPERKELEALTERLGVEKQVEFKGFLFGSKLTDVLQAADIFATASTSENMPLAVLEAMACGLPVLATHSLGLAEMIEDSGNGYLLPPDEPKRMAEKISELLSNSDKLETFSRRSRELALEYSDDAVMGKLEAVYTRAAGLKTKV